MKIIKPNFLIIGATKAGTTSLHRYLSKHPQIFLPNVKEPHYFAYKNKVPKYIGPGSDRFNREVISQTDEYSDLFCEEKSKDSKAIGEASVMYLYFYKEFVDNLIDYGATDVKLIALLRNPTERAFSSYLHLVRDGLEDSKTFEEALGKEEERRKNNWMPLFYYKELGFYDEAVEYVWNALGENMLKVFLYDEFCTDPANVYKQICEYLNLEETYQPDFSVRYNQSGIPKNMLLHSLYLLFRENRYGLNYIKKIIPDGFKQTLIKSNLSKDTMREETRIMLNAHYEASVKSLERLLARDLSAWKKTSPDVLQID